ncbi:hypothetical protein K3722_00235 [Leisingera caerulea]|uniref:Uncharacterized protein n=1 Tax=Leisingera caerulea TaxID=506591 RepID=A0A9Q9HKV4_LEICA|nr:hypothetical protein [Leisingera caerulea]UWQ54015.1 hypothetical protein K3721_00235 [Leisingera caerulea]UWQ58606.1 hypothetical protein K3722_00235 [Leisingera caerulea]UWQ83672.1 hypothetical protein K3726_00235 [Leisingera caerulea]
MNKLIAIVNVVAWAGFWSFGYLALTAESYSETQVVTAALLASAGLITGIIAYLRLVRGSEHSGYARPSARMTREQRDAAQAQWGQVE